MTKIKFCPIALSTLLLFVFTCAASAAEKPKLINTQKALTAYGFPGGSFSKNNKIIKSIDDSIKEKIGTTESKPAIDTGEEFLTAAFYSDITIEDERKEKTVMIEMASGKEGALKLGSMWLRKRIDTASYYDSAIKFICEKSEVTEAEIMAYYREAMSAEIDRIVRMVLKNTPRKLYTFELEPGEDTVNAIDLIKEYYFAPTRKNYENLVKACRYFGIRGAYSYKHRVCFDAMIKILGHLSPGLRDKVVKDLKKK
ncbi:MAG: hypothetical protein GY754_09865 [bacterium]|nr:hypothetical protein [bacterium]